MQWTGHVSIGLEYPLMLYKGTAADRRELVIANLADRAQPQKLLHLGHLQFICFVGTNSAETAHIVYFLAFDEYDIKLCGV